MLQSVKYHPLSTSETDPTQDAINLHQKKRHQCPLRKLCFCKKTADAAPKKSGFFSFSIIKDSKKRQLERLVDHLIDHLSGYLQPCDQVSKALQDCFELQEQIDKFGADDLVEQILFESKLERQIYTILVQIPFGDLEKILGNIPTPTFAIWQKNIFKKALLRSEFLEEKKLVEFLEGRLREKEAESFFLRHKLNPAKYEDWEGEILDLLPPHRVQSAIEELQCRYMSSLALNMTHI
jgi:hypothetical protein